MTTTPSTPEIPSAGEDLLSKIKSALLKDGDFPASAKVVNELKELTSDPRTTAQQMAEVILREPSLSTRVLHLVNSSFYRRAKPIMTVSQAVVAVGMKSIAELCAGLVLLQRFVPMARKGGPFADCFKKSMITSLLSSSFSAEIGGTSEGSTNELGYISGFFSEIGTLLLAYYFPKMYENASKRAELKEITFSESLQQLTGLSSTQLSIEVIKALNLPLFYTEVLKATSDQQRLKQTKVRSLEEEKILVAGKSVGVGYTVSGAIATGDKNELDKVLSLVSSKFNVDISIASKVVGKLPQIFHDHCTTTELSLPPLPAFLGEYSAANVESIPSQSSEDDSSTHSVTNFIDEIKQSIENREPTASVITSCMEALQFGLSFERVLLLLFDSAKRKLIGRMALGIESLNPSSIVRDVEEHPTRVDSLALQNSRPIFQGEPILTDGWPFVVLPIGNNKKGLGVIYADRKNSDTELTEREKAYINILNDLLDRSIGFTKK